MSLIRKEINSLISILTKKGFAFSKVRYIRKQDRRSKIEFILNSDAPLGTTRSPYLKDLTILNIKFFSDKLILSENDRKLLSISDYLNDIEKTVDAISNVYEEYFYTLEDIEFKFFNHKDKDKIVQIVENFSPIRLRSFGVVEDKVYLMFGSGAISFAVNVSEGIKKCAVDTHILKGLSGYTLYNRYHYYSSMSLKHERILSKLCDEVKNMCFKRYINAYNEIKHI